MGRIIIIILSVVIHHSTIVCTVLVLVMKYSNNLKYNVMQIANKLVSHNYNTNTHYLVIMYSIILNDY